MLLIGLESLSCTRRYARANASAGYVLALLAPAAVGTALCGWLLAGSGDYAHGLLQAHRLLGIATAGLCVLMAVFHRFGWRRSYLASLGLGGLLLVPAAHFGASLTHGSDYLLGAAPPSLRAWFGKGAATPSARIPIETNDVFASVIQPILQRRCGDCHNPEKHKADLCVDSFDSLLKGGIHGPVILPGQAAESPLVKRLLLPSSDEDHMPPEGKPQPDSREIAVLQWWISVGAPRRPAVPDLLPPAELRQAPATPAKQRP